MVDFIDMIFFHAEATPDKPAVITGEAILTYGKLRDGILSAQAQLRRLGLKSGDRAAISVPSAIGHVTLICALYRSGIASVSLDNPHADLFTDLAVDAWLTSAPLGGVPVKTILVDDSWFNQKNRDIVVNAARQQSRSNLARLILSSGTTGRPKIIGLSFTAVSERLISYGIRLSTPSWQRIVCMLGLSTNYGFSFTITALWLGRTVCFAYDATARQLILAHQAEMLVASTHQISVVVQAQEENFLRLDSLRAVHIGGSIAYLPLLTRIRMLICNNVICGYGSTEGGTVAYCPSDLILGMDRAVGVVAPWIDLQIVDDARTVQELGREGQIRIRASGQGYRYRKTSATEYEAEDAEWFYPGDTGIMYRNGLLMVLGRVTELINRGGVKVSPETIEEAIKKHPLVADAAAVGMLDKIGIEQIWLAVVPRGNKEINVSKMYDYCREAMPAYLPDRIFPVTSIPRNQLGKVTRETLKVQLQALEDSMVLAVR